MLKSPAILLLTLVALTACSRSASTANASPASTTSASGPEEPATSANNVAAQLPEFADFPGTCPKDWGIVVGATQAHVENFIQNYFFVPERSPGAMYSEINTFATPTGGTLIMAGTYNMLDPIVDQEMVATFAAGTMTQCGSRLRCESNREQWVASCD